MGNGNIPYQIHQATIMGVGRGVLYHPLLMVLT